MCRRQPGYERGRLAEARDLLLGERRVGVGGREVRHQPDHLEGRRRELGEPVAAHARVELQVERNAVRQRSVVGDDELEPRLPRLGDLAVRRRAEHDDAGLRELGTQHERLGDGGGAQARRPSAERTVGDVDRTVAVAVRLDDGPQLGTGEGREQHLRVATDCAEVDRELRSRHRHTTPARRGATRRRRRRRGLSPALVSPPGRTPEPPPQLPATPRVLSRGTRRSRR